MAIRRAGGHENVMSLTGVAHQVDKGYVFGHWIIETPLYCYFDSETGEKISSNLCPFFTGDSVCDFLQALAFFEGIADGLEFIHKSGFCHRDLKFSSIMNHES